MLGLVLVSLCVCAGKRHRSADTEFRRLLQRVMEEQAPEKQAPVDTKADLRRRRNDKAKRMLDVILPEFENAKAEMHKREMRTLVREIVEKQLRKHGVDDQLAYDVKNMRRILGRAQELKEKIKELHESFEKLRK